VQGYLVCLSDQRCTAGVLGILVNPYVCKGTWVVSFRYHVDLL
jgi:hypothetical protein